MLMKLEADLVFISLSNSLSSNNVYGESLFRVVLYANKNIFLFLSKCVLLSVFCNIRNLSILSDINGNDDSRVRSYNDFQRLISLSNIGIL